MSQHNFMRRSSKLFVMTLLAFIMIVASNGLIALAVKPAEAIVSDDFNACALDTDRWTLVDPLGDATVSMTGAGTGDAQLLFSVPAGLSHNAWNANTAPLLLQAADDTDFAVEAKFDSLPELGYQGHGIFVQQDSDNWLRFDFFSNGLETRVYAAITVDGVTTQKINQLITPGAPMYLRVQRTGNDWTQSYSYDGVGWPVAGSFTHAMEVTAVGPFVANVDLSGDNAPAYTAVIDYFFNQVSPIDPEDGGPAPYSAVGLDVTVVGEGAVTAYPDPAYGCGDEVTLIAEPEPGWVFMGWSGDLSGSDNPAFITMDFDKNVTAMFLPDSDIESDDFNACALDTDRWTLVDPLGDATVYMTGAGTGNAQLLFSVPAGLTHDAYKDVNTAPLLLQGVDDTDFAVEAKFDSPLELGFQGHGIFVEEDDDNWLRFDFYSNGQQPHVFAAITVDGVTTDMVDQAIIPGAPMYLRVLRIGDDWRQSYSYDGIDWIEAVSFEHAMEVNAVGPFVANYDRSGVDAPAYTAVIDYFFNVASPIELEDGGPVIGEPTLDVTVTGQGEVTRNEYPPYICYQEVMLTAEPEQGWVFIGWSGDLSGSDSTAFITMDFDKNVTATFAAIPTITAIAGPNGSISPSGAVTVGYGGSQTFTITPAAGYQVADVLVDSVSVGAVTSHEFTNVTDDHTLSATFAIKTYTITASASSGGSVSPLGQVIVAHDASQTFTIAADPGYHIDDVVVDGVPQGPITLYTFTNITASHTISATFAIETYTIIASSGDNGSITPTGYVTVAHGSSQTFTITHDTGYDVAEVLVDGTPIGAVTQYTFTDVTKDHTISATFAINIYTISATAGANGTISPSDDIGVEYGASQPFTITPNAHYHVADVLVDGVSVGAVTEYTFTDVNADHIIRATFAIDTYTITATAGANGSISPVGELTVVHGSSQIFTIKPDTGYHIADVKVDGISVGAVTEYTFTEIIDDHAIRATFAIDTYTITASAGEGGSISPSGAVTVEYGAGRTFTITPDTYWNVDDVVVDGASQGPLTEYAFTNVTDGHTISATFVQNDDDSDGASDLEEQGPNGDDLSYDGNGDSIPDCTQDNVASMNTHDGQSYVTLAVPDKALLNNCRALDNPDPGTAPSGVDFAYGFFDFTIEDADPTGPLTTTGAVTLEIYLDGTAPTTYYKYGPTPNNLSDHWYEFMYDEQTKTGAKINGNVITLYFVDGERGDDILVPAIAPALDGKIIDQGGPGTTSSSVSSPSSSGGGGGGGCFIATAAFGSLVEPHVQVLRDFRDCYLLTNTPGKIFVDLYYTYSPPIADFIAEHDALRMMVRWSLLPLIGVSYAALHFGPGVAMALVVLLLALMSATAWTVVIKRGPQTRLDIDI